MPKIRNRVFTTIYACQLGFIEKTRFLCPPAAIRNRVFVTIFACQLGFIEKTRFLTTRTNQKPGFCHNIYFPISNLFEKTRFLTATRKNPVSLTLVQAVRRCEIVGGASRFLVAAYPTNDVIWRHGFPLFNDRSRARKVKQNCNSIAQNFGSNSIYRSRVYLSFKSPELWFCCPVRKTTAPFSRATKSILSGPQCKWHLRRSPERPAVSRTAATDR